MAENTKATTSTAATSSTLTLATKEDLPFFWWVRDSFSPWYFNRWFLLFSVGIYSIVSYIVNNRFELNTFASSGAVITLGGLLLNIKHGQIFHRRNLSYKQKHEHYTGAGLFSSIQFSVEDLILIKNVMLDEILGTLLVILGTLIWAYG